MRQGRWLEEIMLGESPYGQWEKDTKEIISVSIKNLLREEICEFVTPKTFLFTAIS